MSEYSPEPPTPMKEWSDGHRSVKWFVRGKRVRLEFTDGDVFEIIYTDPVQAELYYYGFRCGRLTIDFLRSLIKP
jgi:hypothetical protein